MGINQESYARKAYLLYQQKDQSILSPQHISWWAPKPMCTKAIFEINRNASWETSFKNGVVYM